MTYHKKNDSNTSANESYLISNYKEENLLLSSSNGFATKQLLPKPNPMGHRQTSSYDASIINTNEVNEVGCFKIFKL